jgi:hypothetical protein
MAQPIFTIIALNNAHSEPKVHFGGFFSTNCHTNSGVKKSNDDVIACLIGRLSLSAIKRGWKRVDNYI